MADDATSPPPTLGGLFRRAALRAFVVVGLVALAIGLYAWRVRRAHPEADPRLAQAAWCQEQYAHASRATDSSVVDAEHPPAAGRSGTTPLCRELRLSGRTSP